MRKSFFFVISILILSLSLSSLTAAQTDPEPQIFATWKASTYAPGNYPGKALPTGNSAVVVSFEVIDNGRIADLSNQTIYWYSNNKLVSNKKGVQSIHTISNDVVGGTRSIRIELPDYRNRTLIKTIDIESSEPQALIESNAPNGTFSGTALKFKARPFFFNITNPSQLVYSWLVNDKEPSGEENPDELIVNVAADAPLGTEVSVLLEIKNPKGTDQSATTAVSLKKAP